MVSFFTKEDSGWIIVEEDNRRKNHIRNKRYIWVPRITCTVEEQREYDNIGDKMTQKLFEEWNRKVVQRWKQDHPNVPNSQYL
jgi:hypothetical protein